MAYGPIPLVDAVFKVDIRRYSLSNGRTYLASVHAPRIPTSLRRYFAGAGRVSTYPWVHTAEPQGGGFSPTGLSRAYDIQPLRSAGMDGSGETVVFPEIDGADISALREYQHLYHLPPFHITFHGDQLKAGDEATMDLEVVHAIAPQAKLVVYSMNGHVTNAGWTQQSLNMIRHSRGDVISSSVGGCDGGYNSSDALDYANAAQQADLLGESMFASSGDNGAFDCIGHGDLPSSRFLGVDMPAALPGVTAVGGTRLTVTTSGKWYDETVWDGPIETAGGGGGVSRFFVQPSWQNAPGVTRSNGMNPRHARMVPDVSADADPSSGATLIFPEGTGQGGGTSQAAPLWAGIAALIDEYLKNNGHAPVGWMNPALYYLARSHPAYPPFHDVTVGNNLHYSAGPGYDMTTGLGTPDAWNLARDLLAYQKARGR